MKKVITFFVVLFMGVLNVQATDTLELCEYSEEYKAWLRLSDEEKASTIMPSMCKQDNHNINLLGSNDYSMDYFNLADSWSYCKGDTYNDICVILTSNLNKLPSNDFSIKGISQKTINMLYVAMTRTKKDLYIISNDIFKKISDDYKKI